MPGKSATLSKNCRKRIITSKTSCEHEAADVDDSSRHGQGPRGGLKTVTVVLGEIDDTASRAGTTRITKRTQSVSGTTGIFTESVDELDQRHLQGHEGLWELELLDHKDVHPEPVDPAARPVLHTALGRR